MGIKKIPLPKENRIELADPALTGARLRLKGKIPEGRVYLYYEVERTAASALGCDTLQSDYETKWQSHKNAGKTRLDA
jgi:hypothetical protein